MVLRRQVLQDPLNNRMMVMFRPAIAALVATLVVAMPAAAQAPDFRPQLAAAQGRLAVNLVQRLARSGKRIVAVSPASLAGAAAALDLGASADMRGALHQVLGFAGGDNARDLAALRGSLSQLAARGEGGPLRVYNATLFDDDVSLYPGVALAFREAGLKHAVMDFSAGGVAEMINGEVRKHTAGLIPEIIDRMPSGRLIAVNAVYFKDRWKTPFDAAETRPAPFRRISGGTVAVATMHLPEGRYRFRQDPQFVGIDLPYADERYSMTIVTTRGDRPAPARAFRPVGDWLAGNGFAPAPGDLALPGFALSSREDLTGALDRLGLRRARFARDALAGFSAEDLSLSRVLQRIELRLTEEGTEAAAATAAVEERAATPGYVHLVVDRPFVFALRDNATGLILIAGYVGEPTPLVAAAR
jgi:serine protease inhibitor